MSGLLIRMIQWFQTLVSVKRTLCESNELKLPKENRYLNYTCQKQTSRFNETSFKICSGGIKNTDNTTSLRSFNDHVGDEITMCKNIMNCVVLGSLKFPQQN